MSGCHRYPGSEEACSILELGFAAFLPCIAEIDEHF